MNVLILRRLIIGMTVIKVSMKADQRSSLAIISSLICLEPGFNEGTRPNTRLAKVGYIPCYLKNNLIK